MRAWRWGTIIGLLLAIGIAGGCVRRVWEAPGLRPGSPWTVSSDMRVETFEFGEHVVRSFRMEISDTNHRRYQFVVHNQTEHEADFTLDTTSTGLWELVERRPDGISVTRQSWEQEPAYATVKAAVIRLLGGS